MHVVVVDDERRMVELIATYLADHDIRTTAAHDGPGGLAAARRPDVDAVVLDLMLPGMDGTEVCRRLRADGSDVPVLMLTARGAVPERVAGLDAGADDYLVKPFALAELHARLRALQRRRDPGTEATVVCGDVVVDREQQRVWVADTEVALGRREFAMLDCLVQHRGRVVTRQRLFDDVWDDTDIRSNSIDVHMSRLRTRLEGSQRVTILTVRGIGYRLELSGT